jgi:hypothetical protein
MKRCHLSTPSSTSAAPPPDFTSHPWSHFLRLACRYAIGHASLDATIGARPRYGWQIDPFGASALTPEILSLMGYKALVHHRINQRLTGRFLNVDELQQWSGGMLTSRGMQFDWKFSKSSPPLLTHVMEVPPSLFYLSHLLCSTHLHRCC